MAPGRSHRRLNRWEIVEQLGGEAGDLEDTALVRRLPPGGELPDSTVAQERAKAGAARLGPRELRIQLTPRRPSGLLLDRQGVGASQPQSGRLAWRQPPPQQYGVSLICR